MGIKAGSVLAGVGLGYWAWNALNPGPGASLRGQVALVTGGSRGLGLLMARELAELGCKVAICARDEEELARAQAEIEALGAEVLAVRCDVGDRAEVSRLLATVVARFGTLDVLINNAGVIQVGPLASLTMRDFEHAMASNFWGVVNVTLAALPIMRRQGYGRIATIDSIGGRVAVPHLLPYDCAKFAARGFTEGLRAELAGTGIHVTTILPGLMRTGSPLHAGFKGEHALEFLWFSAADSTPLTAMDARRAAKRIVLAVRRGETELTLTWQAKLLGLAHDLFPAATINALGLVNRLLPKAAGPSGTIEGADIDLPNSARPLRDTLNRQGDRTNQRPPASAIW
jgi:NAD(P)-dependent dehydrogenase (short-subunit alcohol dehydrogenase family)